MIRLLLLHTGTRPLYILTVCHVIHSLMMVRSSCLQQLTIVLVCEQQQDCSLEFSCLAFFHVSYTCLQLQAVMQPLPLSGALATPTDYIVKMNFHSFFSSVWGRDCSEIETDPKADPFDK